MVVIIQCINVPTETIENSAGSGVRPDGEERDLGFGSIVSGQSRQRLINPDGSFNVQRSGLPFRTTLNLFHIFLEMRWASFLSLLLAIYFVSNIVFGMGYAAFGEAALVDTSADATQSIYIRGFFFSVQTFATIGYGTIHPVGIIPNLLVTVESYYSLLVNALITGVVFARFARPTARLIYSEIAVVAPYRDTTGLMFRLVNGRNNQLIEVTAQVIFSRLVAENGRPVRRFDLLELERSKVSFFPLAWTVVHPITMESPLKGLSHQDLLRSDAEILILMSAIDETFAQVVHTRTSYKPSQIKFGHKFISIYREVPEGEPISIDVRRLSSVERAES